MTGLNRDAGYLFQSDALFPWKTAIDNVAIGLDVAGAPHAEAQRRAQAFLTSVGLGGFGNRYPHMLSGGQRKRVGLAQVLIRDPKILLMDEPFGPLDAQTRQIMGNLLLELWNADRKAVLFVTHDLEEAIALADRVVIMSAGPSARIIGNWRVPLARPRDISEVRMDRQFHELHREIWGVLKDEVMKGYAQSSQARRPADVAAKAAVVATGGRRGSAGAAGSSSPRCRCSARCCCRRSSSRRRSKSPARFSTCSGAARSGSTSSITLLESILAFVIGSVLGVLVGFWFARQPLIAAIFDPYVKMINALPRVILAPIFALWLGLGIWSKVALGVTLVFFIVFFNVYQGVKEVSTTVLDNGRMLGMSERQLTRHVYWPSALSWMFSSLHTAVGFAVVGAVVGEYLGSAAGLGYLIQQAEGVFDVAACVRRHVRAVGLCHPDRLCRDAGGAAAAGLAADGERGQG